MITKRKLLNNSSKKFFLTNGQNAILYKNGVPYFWMKADNEEFRYGPMNENGKPITKDCVKMGLTESIPVIAEFLKLNNNELVIDIMESDSE